MARKRTKKATTRVGGNVITHDTYKFKSEYSDFKSEMQAVGGGSIGVKGKTLFEMIANHGVGTRDTSPNDGKSVKTSNLIKTIEDLFEKEYMVKKDLDLIKNFISTLNEIEGDEELDPRNIVFTEPADYEVVGRGDRKRVVAVGKKTRKVYGHFLTPYYAAKHGGESNSEWYNKDPGVANPPLYAAIFGEGFDGSKSLKQILEEAAEEVDDAPIEVEINNLKKVDALTKVSGIARFINAAFKLDALYDGNILSKDKLADHFNAARITLSDVQGKKLAEALGLTGDINAVTFNLDASETEKLVRGAATRNPRVKEVDSLERDGEKVVLKWEDILRA